MQKLIEDVLFEDLEFGTADNSTKDKAINANISPDQQRQIDLATEQFKQSVRRVDNQILQQYVQAIQNGSYAEAEAILKNAEESQQTNTLMFALLTIGAILLPLYAKQRIQNLLTQFGLHTVFAATDSGQKALKQQAEKGAKSHVRTIAKDLKRNLDDAIDSQLTNPDIEAQVKEKYEDLQEKDSKAYLAAVHKDKNIYEYARELILAGESRQTVIKKLQENFAEVGKRRADVIAGNEANRVFTMSQFDADQQFLAQNKLTNKAYKRLVSNTGTPEAICKSIIEKTRNNPIPFKDDFLKFNQEYTTKDDTGKIHKFTPKYEHLKSGHIHVNCHCRYELLIRRDDGTFFNSNTGKTENELDFEEDKHKRSTDGKFAKKSFSVDFNKLGDLNVFNKWVEDNYWEGTYGHHSEETTDSIRGYQGHFYDAINSHLRHNKPDSPLDIYGTRTTYNGAIDNIKDAANIKLAEDTTLYRGTDTPYHKLNKVGSKINSRSFLSTSTVKEVAHKFIPRSSTTGVSGGSMVIINAKKGQRVVVPDLVTFGSRGNTLNEAEILINPGSRLVITRIDGENVYADLK